MADFEEVASRVEPVSEAMCSRISPNLDCDFLILVDDRPNAPANAFHTVDRTGRPLIIFTQPMIAEFQSRDEIALVMGHEAAHHIAQHIPETQRSANVGALLGGLVGIFLGGDSAATAGASETSENLARLGAYVGSRIYSKDNELEADRLGALICENAGYDAIHGSQIFTRIDDPENRFLATHPPNAARIDAIHDAVAVL